MPSANHPDSICIHSRQFRMLVENASTQGPAILMQHKIWKRSLHFPIKETVGPMLMYNCAFNDARLYPMSGEISPRRAV